MDYKIIVDSASNRVDDSLFDENIGYSVAPLTIHVGDKEYRDTKEEDVASFLDEITTTKEKVKTSCPSPRDYFSKTLVCTGDLINHRFSIIFPSFLQKQPGI